jgi:uncharacterized surface protein with fasciclin (FAS1) repeats
MNRRTLFGFAAAAGLSTLAACSPMATTSQPDIVGVLSTNDQFSTLVAAVGAADLVGTLQGEGPFTVFAPTNAAFEKLPAGTVETLLMPENRDTLVSILTYHVVPGAVTSDQLAGQTLSVATVEGSDVDINGTHGVRVDNATVTQADISVSNGVIHRIDTVLMP